MADIERHGADMARIYLSRIYLFITGESIIKSPLGDSASLTIPESQKELQRTPVAEAFEPRFIKPRLFIVYILP